MQCVRLVARIACENHVLCSVHRQHGLGSCPLKFNLDLNTRRLVRVASTHNLSHTPYPMHETCSVPVKSIRASYAYATDHPTPIACNAALLYICMLVFRTPIGETHRSHFRTAQHVRRVLDAGARFRRFSLPFFPHCGCACVCCCNLLIS